MITTKKIGFLFLTSLMVACGGNEAVPPAPVIPPQGSPDTTPPSVKFEPNTLTLPELVREEITLIITDNVGITASSVQCFNGLSYADGVLITPAVKSETRAECTASAEDNSGNSGSDTLYVTIQPQLKTDEQKLE